MIPRSILCNLAEDREQPRRESRRHALSLGGRSLLGMVAGVYVICSVGYVLRAASSPLPKGSFWSDLACAATTPPRPVWQKRRWPASRSLSLSLPLRVQDVHWTTKRVTTRNADESTPSRQSPCRSRGLLSSLSASVSVIPRAGLDGQLCGLTGHVKTPRLSLSLSAGYVGPVGRGGPAGKTSPPRPLVTRAAGYCCWIRGLSFRGCGASG